MSKKKLNQIIALAHEIKPEAESKFTKIYQLFDKPSLFDGFHKDYAPVSETGMKLPSESTRVQQTVRDLTRQLVNTLSSALQIEARRDYTNMYAKADVVLKDGTVLFTDAPVPLMLSLEKRLGELYLAYSKVPILSSDKNWKQDTNDGLYKSDKSSTHKTEKSQVPIVLYDATPEHPAQTQLITKDTIIGHWETVHHSGAIPRTERDAILERIVDLRSAIILAREKANMQDEAETPLVGEAIYGYIFATPKVAEEEKSS